MKRKRIAITGLVVFGLLATAALYQPASTPPYLARLKPAHQSWGTTTLEVPASNSTIEHALDGEIGSGKWTQAGSIDYGTDRGLYGTNYVANRFLKIEWGWPTQDLLEVKITRKSLLVGLVSPP
jgi:hypothetical protein